MITISSVCSINKQNAISSLKVWGYVSNTRWHFYTCNNLTFQCVLDIKHKIPSTSRLLLDTKCLFNVIYFIASVHVVQTRWHHVLLTCPNDIMIPNFMNRNQCDPLTKKALFLVAGCIKIRIAVIFILVLILHLMFSVFVLVKLWKTQHL